MFQMKSCLNNTTSSHIHVKREEPQRVIATISNSEKHIAVIRRQKVANPSSTDYLRPLNDDEVLVALQMHKANSEPVSTVIVSHQESI